MQPRHAVEFNIEEHILGHIKNSHEWHLPFLNPIPVPGITLHGLMLIFAAVFLIWLFCFVYQKNQKVPTGLTNLLEVFVLFIRDQIVVPSLGPQDGQKFTPLFCTFFFFILVLNLMGMIPIFSSATANINVTGALAMVTLAFMLLGAIYKNGVSGFLKSLVPPGIPVPILLLIVPLEFLGLFIKAFALMIRLFANMLAGHMVLLLLIGIVGVVGLIALPMAILALFISLLEVFVAFLQAYIFTLLSAVFMGQMYHPEH